MYYYPIKVKNAYVIREQDKSNIHNYRFKAVIKKNVRKYTYEINQIASVFVNMIIPQVSVTTVNTNCGTLARSLDSASPIGGISGAFYNDYDESYHSFGISIFNNRVTDTKTRVDSEGNEYQINVYSSGWDSYIDGNSISYYISSVDEDMGTPESCVMYAYADYNSRTLTIDGELRYVAYLKFVYKSSDGTIHGISLPPFTGSINAVLLNDSPPNPQGYSLYSVDETITEEEVDASILDEKRKEDYYSREYYTDFSFLDKLKEGKYDNDNNS